MTKETKQTRNTKQVEQTRKNVDIYTDGACSGNPGPGGWAAILIASGREKEISGFEESTTNNRMELTAAIEALKVLKFPCNVSLFSDSSYLVNAFLENWMENWKRNGWKNASKSPVSNADLWHILDDLSQIHDIKWIKVKGHSDDPYNNRCDKLAVDQIKANTSKASYRTAETDDTEGGPGYNV